MTVAPDATFDVGALAEHQLITPDNAVVRLGSLWADQAQLILFLRHFG